MCGFQNPKFPANIGREFWVLKYMYLKVKLRNTALKNTIVKILFFWKTFGD